MENVPQPDVVEKAISIPEQPEPSKEEVATLIADTLREMEEGARKDILHIVRAVGRTAARELLATTLQTQEQGGILLPDESTLQSPNAIFFHLAYTVARAKNGEPVHPYRYRKPRQDKPASQQQTEPSVQEIAVMIAQRLGETDPVAQQQIQRIVWALGQTAAQGILEQTLQIEQNGGMMLHDGSRRRTAGGVFFHLAYTTGQPLEGRRLKRPTYQKPKPEKQAQEPSDQQPKQKASNHPSNATSLFQWENRREAVKEAENEKGQATVKITVIGRPGKIVDKGSCIVTMMESTKVPMLPKGLPTPTNVPTKYAVYIASKQWKKVEEAIKDPEDTLIIEGFPKTDPEVSAIAVFATNVTTKKLQMAKRQPQATQ